MQTVILMWNPAFSSYKMDQFLDELHWLHDGFYNDYNWSIWDYEHAQKGDRYFMIRVGQGNTGIVQAGYLSSEPYKDQDWSGKGREIYYMDLAPEYYVNSDKFPFISVDELMQKLPGFDWTGGHAGRILPPELAEKLEQLWAEYILQNKDSIDGVNAARDPKVDKSEE